MLDRQDGIYFSPAIARTLGQLPEPEQALLFAKEWSELEARTKACKMGLKEWSEGRDMKLAQSRLLWQRQIGEGIVSVCG
ncbi:hypothetical protein [Iodobacter ciconiae]|uniref:Uncharacterized protein n=1 Tax=Iodobacter ciconiae TaxID=2496266 RepID=A0A3S8ZTE1_9NEIS|nr:hypothetical protein [Iodobacter ciconiae]AZN36742.1 hypothetical protein EJO50_09715 [Iodobacter ciconiae]